MSFQPSVGYELEQLRKAGRDDDFTYLATTTLSSLTQEMLEAGWSEDDLRDELENAIANYEPETEDDEE